MSNHPATTAIEDSRIADMNDAPIRVASEGAKQPGRYVLYAMQQSQRAEQNPALEHAVKLANRYDLPLVVSFAVMNGYPGGSNLRHCRFMLEGLRDAGRTLADRKAKFVVRIADPVALVTELANDAAHVVVDRGYLRHQRGWLDQVADGVGCRVTRVEGDVVVPVDEVSDKAEHAARTIRKKINSRRDGYLVRLRATTLENGSRSLPIDGLDVTDVDGILAQMAIDRSVTANPLFVGGTTEAKRLFRDFLKRFGDYDAHRNQPQTDEVSHMSKYLHFGQISPVWLACEVHGSGHGGEEDRASFLEELIVRRELAMNFCEFTPDYDRYSTIPGWAARSLDKHKADDREHVYTAAELEAGETHDPYWNAAMKEMRETGYMHNYMRMYWGKKIIEWTSTPQHAHEVALALNNKHFIDGRDANSYANIGWLFGVHDRGWTERPVFGKVRYMNANGLERKCDPKAYVEKVDRYVEEVKAARDAEM